MNYVYLLRCSDGSLYCGWTTDPERRVRTHNRGNGARYTRSRLPVELVYLEEWATKQEAMSREWHIKRLSRAAKEQLVRNRCWPECREEAEGQQQRTEPEVSGPAEE